MAIHLAEIGVNRLIVTIVSFAIASVSQVASAAEQVDFVMQIKPVFAARCYACHSALRQHSGLRLDTAALLIQGGDGGAGVVPGNSQDSLLISMVTGESGVRMPPEEEGASLTDAQIALLRTWIDQAQQRRTSRRLLTHAIIGHFNRRSDQICQVSGRHGLRIRLIRSWQRPMKRTALYLPNLPTRQHYYAVCISI